MYTVSTNVREVTQPGIAIFLVVGCTRFLLSAAADLFERKERVVVWQRARRRLVKTREMIPLAAEQREAE